MILLPWGVRAIVFGACVASVTVFAKDNADRPIDKKCSKESSVKIECPGKDCPGGKPQDCADSPSKAVKKAAKKVEGKKDKIKKAAAEEKKGDDTKKKAVKEDAKP